MSDDEADLGRRFAAFSTYLTTPAEALKLFDEARSVCPIPHSDQLGGFRLFLTYEDVRKGLLDWRTFASGPSVLRPTTKNSPRFPPLDFDPPEHAQWRKIFTEGLNAKTPGRIEQAVRADAIRLIGGFASAGRCDLVADLAGIVPMNALFHILGIDEALQDWVRDMTASMLASVSEPERFHQLFAEFAALGYAEVEKRRVVPRDDYLSSLAEATIDGRPLSPIEVGSAMNSLLVAGHGTTVASLTNLLWEVVSRPPIKQQLLDNPALIPIAVEEALRMHTPFFGLYRRATADVAVRDVVIEKDESVYMCWQAANRDPTQFDTPNDFRLDRESSSHLTFGLGRHSCVGAPSARLQLRIVLEELLARLPDIELAISGSAPFEFMGAETCAIRSLPAKFTSRAR